MRSSAPAATSGITAAALIPVLVLTFVWGCNWPILKMGVAEIAPLYFRGLTLPLAGIGLLAIAYFSGERIAVPRSLWARVACLALFNIAIWNGLILFGVRQLPAGRSAILAYTMPVWTVLISLFVLHEPLSRRRIVGLVLGMAGMTLLLGDDFRQLQRAPTAALLILAAAFAWAIGTVLLRKWKVAVPQNALTAWLMIIGSAPLVLLGPVFAPWPDLAALSKDAWFAVIYNIVLAGTLAHWAWFTLARTLPVAISSMSSLAVPVVGVFSGMVVLNERPGTAEWVALLLVMGALVAVLWTPRPPAAPLAPDD
jgi:drug/metabolite transporter (DMT)-like permease